MPPNAVQTYHDLLTDDLAAATQAHLDEQQRRRGLTFGGRPLCTVLRPRFLTPDQFSFVQAKVRVLMRALRRCHEVALADAAFRRQFRLSEAEEALLADDPGYDCPMPTSRLDAFFGPNAELRFTEYNAETPAGAAYGDVLAEAFLTAPVVRRVLRRYRLSALPARPGVFHALLSAFEQWSGSASRRASPSSTGAKCPPLANLCYSRGIFETMAWSA